MTSPPPADARRPVAIVMAAGLGTRMRSKLPKVLHPLCGRPMLAYVIDAGREATGSEPLVVYSEATSAIVDAFAGAARFVRQPEPRGTGDAVAVALGQLPAAAGEILVLSGDVPGVTPALLEELLEARRLDEAVISLVAVEAFDPSGLGRVVRTPAGSVDRIVEERDADDEQRAIAQVNAGIYAFDARWLRDRIGALHASPATGELYLTELVAIARAEGRLVTAVDVEDSGPGMTGINDRSQLAQAEWDLRTDLNVAHMRAGVTMHDPSTVYIDATVELASDVVLEANVVIRGRTRIAEGTTIGSGSRIEDSVVGRDCRIVASVIERSEVEDGATIGPFSHLRPGSSIGPNAEVGNYAEIKNSRLGPGVKSHHMSYLGDADIGAGTNIGAGTITANYDGVHKLRTTIGERAFLGVHTMLRAPVTIGDGAKTGAGAIVTHDVPPGALVVGVPARVVEPHAATAARPVEPTATPESLADAAAPGRAKPAAGGRTPAP